MASENLSQRGKVKFARAGYIYIYIFFFIELDLMRSHNFGDVKRGGSAKQELK